MIMIEVVEDGYQIARGGTTYRTIHKAMRAAEKQWERYGKVIEWAKDPASGDYVGFPYAPKTLVAPSSK